MTDEKRRKTKQLFSKIHNIYIVTTHLILILLYIFLYIISFLLSFFTASDLITDKNITVLLTRRNAAKPAHNNGTHTRENCSS
jgi:hypothetical protein